MGLVWVELWFLQTLLRLLKQWLRYWVKQELSVFVTIKTALWRNVQRHWLISEKKVEFLCALMLLHVELTFRMSHMLFRFFFQSITCYFLYLFLTLLYWSHSLFSSRLVGLNSFLSLIKDFYFCGFAKVFSVNIQWKVTSFYFLSLRRMSHSSYCAYDLFLF